jgi:hypothetical protein
MRISFAVLLLLSFNLYAAIGSVSDHKGNDCNIERNKQKLGGQKGADIESMDTYVTGGCVSNITFKDDTKVKVNENSRLVIDDFVFDPNKSDAGKLALKVGMGTVRYASGQIAKNDPQKVAIKTPTASIAVRGTDFSMTVEESGQSLVALLPSCKDEKDVKKYELEENTCAVGKIEVSTMAGTVTLDKAFEATYVLGAMIAPTPPVVMNIVESKINNTLILSPPNEIKNAVKNASKSQKDKDNDTMEADGMAITAMKSSRSTIEITQASVLKSNDDVKKESCNIASQICVFWDKPEEDDMSARGKGIAIRHIENEHYAEVKTSGYNSNTFVTMDMNGDIATKLIGDEGSSINNIVTIRQSSNVPRVK